MQVLEISIVWGHAIILEILQRMHSLIRHICLGQHLCQLTGTVITEINEDDHITIANRPIYLSIMDRFDKLICHPLIITFLHGLQQISGLLSLPFNEQVIGLLDTIPAFIPVHGIETTDNISDMGTIGITGLLYLCNKALATLRVCITTVHEAMNKHLLQMIGVTDLDEFLQMSQGRVYATGRSQSHDMQLLSGLLGITIGADHLLVL